MMVMQQFQLGFGLTPECDTMTERMKFVARLLEGERMSDVCKDFGISRKTGYKIYSRFQEDGMPGLADQSRSARSRPNQTEKAVERAIIHAREEHPTWDQVLPPETNS
jgi:transposase